MIVSNTKEEYQKRTEERLRSIRTRISALEKKVGEAEADIEVRYDQKMEQVRGQYAQVKDKLEEIGNVRQGAWREQKTELERAINSLSEAVESVARQLSV